ncbi:MAG: hypothetical protein JWO47_886 [Candidatus Saccharibacteria bacterium]|nr:hypothetical protein [Candidatus Saccharibacteria bacterium]
MAEQNPFKDSSNNKDLKAAIEAARQPKAFQDKAIEYLGKRSAGDYIKLTRPDDEGISHTDQLFNIIRDHGTGFGAIFDPDKALIELADEAVNDLLDPQKTERYKEMEGDPNLSYIKYLEQFPDEDIRNAVYAHRRTSAGISSFPDTGTHVLQWEVEDPVSINNQGQILSPPPEQF